MTITEGRMSRYKKKKEHQKKVVGTTFGTLLILGVLTSAILVFSIVHLYIGTKNWNNSMKHLNMSAIAPEYVSDYPSAEKQQYIEMSEKVASTNTKIEKELTLPKGTDEILKQADEFVKSKNLKSGTLVDATARLHLYRNYFGFVEHYTQKIDTKTLRDLISELNREVLEHDRSADKEMVAKLNKIVDEYEALRNVLVSVIPEYGTVKGDTLSVPGSVRNLDDLKTQLETVKQFPQMAELLKAVNAEGGKVLRNNKVLAEQKSYKDFKSLVSELDGLYVKRSDVKTYEDVVKNGWSVDGIHKNEDKVIEIVYNGKRVGDSEWIRIDAKPEILMENSWTVPSTTETSSSERTSTSRSSDRTSDSSTTRNSTRTESTTQSGLTEPSENQQTRD